MSYQIHDMIEFANVCLGYCQVYYKAGLWLAVTLGYAVAFVINFDPFP